MKILHQFLKNLSKYHMGMYLIPIIFLSLNNTLANGLYYKFSTTNKALEEKSQKDFKALINRDFSFSDIKDIRSVSLDYDFLNTLIFYTPSRYVLLGSTNKCSLYDLLSTDLSRSPTGEVKYIVFNYENKRGEIKKHILKKNIFLEKIAYKQCTKIKKFKMQFTTLNIKNHIESLASQVPKSYNQCFQNFRSFIKDSKSIYICNIIENIKKLPKRQEILKSTRISKQSALTKQVEASKKYKSIIKPGTLNSLWALCSNINSQKRYCDSKFKVSYWSKLLKKNLASESMKNHCPSSNQSKIKLKNCISELRDSPTKCFFSSNSSLQPQPDCNKIEKALSISRLYTEYKDCPGDVGSEAVTQYSRILSHFDNDINENNKACYLNSTIPLAKYDKNHLDSTLWNVKLCYNDTLKRKEICTPVVIGESQDNDLSFTVVLGKILNRLKGFNNKQQSCSLITSKEYQPALLKFKTGCFVIKDLKDCNGIKCKFKVMINEEEFKEVALKSNLEFDIFPNNYANENKSMLKLVQRHQKKRVKKIRNMSSLQRVYKLHKDAIFAGMGCAEILLPSFFKMKNLSQCTILPFIADGIIESNGYYSLTIRSSYDNVHAPRIIPWRYVYQSIIQYQKIHPLNLWSFYAFY